MYQRVRDHCHYTGKFRGAAHSIFNLRYKISKTIPVALLNGSTYDYHFTIKQLAEDFKGQFECLVEDAEKYMFFSVPIKKYDNGKKSRLSYQTLLITYLKLTKKKCPECIRRKIKSECEFIEFKNDRLHYRCKKSKKDLLSQKMN